MKLIADPRIACIDEDEDGCEIVLKNGWQIDGVHSIFEDTRLEASAHMSDVTRCQCKHCNNRPSVADLPRSDLATFI